MIIPIEMVCQILKFVPYFEWFSHIDLICDVFKLSSAEFYRIRKMLCPKITPPNTLMKIRYYMENHIYI
jgi:hypothetical protein